MSKQSTNEMNVFLSNSETLETQISITEEKYEKKLSILETHLKKFYSQELKVRPADEQILKYIQYLLYI